MPITAAADLETSAHAAGFDAHARGAKCVPAHDQRCFDLLREGNPGGTVGHPNTLLILRAWHRGWHQRNARAEAA